MITLVRAVQTSMACPSQWDAWDAEGNYYYLRYRHGHGSVEQYEDENWTDAEPGQWHRTISWFNEGDHLDGVIELPRFAELAGLVLSPDLVTTGFGDHLRDELITRHGVSVDEASDITQPWRKL